MAFLSAGEPCVHMLREPLRRFFTMKRGDSRLPGSALILGRGSHVERRWEGTSPIFVSRKSNRTSTVAFLWIRQFVVSDTSKRPNSKNLLEGAPPPQKTQ